MIFILNTAVGLKIGEDVLPWKRFESAFHSHSETKALWELLFFSLAVISKAHYFLWDGLSAPSPILEGLRQTSSPRQKYLHIKKAGLRPLFFLLSYGLCMPRVLQIKSSMSTSCKTILSVCVWTYIQTRIHNTYVYVHLWVLCMLSSCHTAAEPSPFADCMSSGDERVLYQTVTQSFIHPSWQRHCPERAAGTADGGY